MRITILGPSGSGKSTFARQLAAITELPVYHLDKLFWGPNWKMTPTPQWHEIVANLAREERWIIDGNYRATLNLRVPFSTHLILLDYPRRIFMSRLTKRYILKPFRPDLHPECVEHLRELPEHLIHVWNWPRRARPDIIYWVSQLRSDQTFIHLTSPRQARQLLRQFRTKE